MPDLDRLWQLRGMPDQGQFLAWIEACSRSIEQQLTQRGIARRFSIVLEPDVGTASSVSDNGADLTVFIPEGLPLRFVYMARLMLRYYPNTYHVAVLDSPFDGYSPDHYFVSETLTPALGDFRTIASFSTAFATCWTRWDNGSAWDDELPILLRMAIQHVFSHELAHATRQHFTLRRNPDFIADLGRLDAELAAGRPMDIGPLSLERVFELDADLLQGDAVANDHLSELASEPGQNPTNMALRDAYALFCLLGIFDARRRQIANYRGQGHLPPILRFQMIKWGYFRAISAYQDALVEMQHADREGFTRAYRAMQDIHWECMAQIGPFSLDPKPLHGPQTITPLSIMVGGMVSAARLARMEEFLAREASAVVELISTHTAK